MQTSGRNEPNHVPYFSAVDRVNMISAGFRVWRVGKREDNQGEEISREEICRGRKKREGENNKIHSGIGCISVSHRFIYIYILLTKHLTPSRLHIKFTFCMLSD